MRYLTHLRERLYQLVCLSIWLLTVDVFLLTFRGSFPLGVYIDCTALALYFIISYIEYNRKKKYYKQVENLLESLDKKFLLPEIMEKGNVQEEVQLHLVLKEMGQSMSGYVNQYKYSNREYKEYIEMWIHEVKIPIATGKLILANHQSDVSKSLEEEFKKIEDYTEQALFYARSNYVEKDYLISNISLEEVVHQTLMRNKRSLIEKRAQMNLHDLNRDVLSDGKWLGFILNQILSNSLKYTGEETLSIELYAEEYNEQIRLYIKDNGIGIRSEDLPLIYEKGFTGNNGRKTIKSTGIGLYLCKKLCARLRHNIDVISEEGCGTTVVLTFAKTSFYDTVS